MNRTGAAKRFAMRRANRPERQRKSAAKTVDRGSRSWSSERKCFAKARRCRNRMRKNRCGGVRSPPLPKMRQSYSHCRSASRARIRAYASRPSRSESVCFLGSPSNLVVRFRRGVPCEYPRDRLCGRRSQVDAKDRTRQEHEGDDHAGDCGQCHDARAYGLDLPLSPGRIRCRSRYGHEVHVPLHANASLRTAEPIPGAAALRAEGSRRGIGSQSLFRSRHERHTPDDKNVS